jgi:phosphatidylserine/phosphatidylglycerophosphate/cardiolipin synthase-like enzyme
MSPTVLFSSLSGGSMTFGNSGGWVKLLRNGEVVDALVYGNGVWPGGAGWEGAGVQPYVVSGEISAVGQVLQRRAGMDTDRAEDWRNTTGQPVYPGWALERFEGGVGVSGGLTVALAPDGSYELVAEALRGAQRSVELETYTLDHVGIGEVLAERARAGVVVRVLADGAPVGGLAEETLWVCERITEAGSGNGSGCWFMRSVEGEKIAKRYRHLHAKFAVIDGERVVLGSENYGKRGMPDDEKTDGTAGHRGVVGVVESREAAEWVRGLFEADLRGADVARWCVEGCAYGLPTAGYEPVRESGGVSYTVREPARMAAAAVEMRLATSPEGHMSALGGVLEWIARAGAGDEILVQQLREAFEWGNSAVPHDNPRVRALVEAAERGAQVLVMLDGGYDVGGKNAATVAALQELGVPGLRAMTANPTGLGIHNKMLLLRVGGERVVHFGSWNGSETSALLNREMSVTAVSSELHEFLRSAFLSDWRGFQPTYLPMLMHEAHYAPRLLISEIMVDPYGIDMGGEWIEIYNAGTSTAQLEQVRVGDALHESEFGPGDGLVQFPGGAKLPAGGVVVIAQDAVVFARRYGRPPDYEIGGYDDAVPDMLPVLRSNAADGVENAENTDSNGSDGGVVNLSNAGDAVALSVDANTILDIVAWLTEDIQELRSFTKAVPSGISLQRWPVDSDTNDCAADFRLQKIPSPGRVP